ncbi:MAG TPA: cobaltochelatase subunit CobN [Stellaceae bacterium]|nr:cobaltochelatase subunit CobN [Stellaceae bacterium]
MADSDRHDVFAILVALAAAGYGVAELPDDPSGLDARLDTTEGEAVMLNDYAAFYASLPATLRDAIAARWGAAERDPYYRPGQVDCGRLLVPASRFGTVAVITTGVATVPPRHAALACAAWMTDAFRADAAIAWRPLGVDLPLPVLIAPTDGAADTTSLLAALDGNVVGRHAWQTP